MQTFYLPEAKEDDSFDAEELCEWVMRSKLLSKHMVEDHKRIQGQRNPDIENDSECPAQPRRIKPDDL